jgi:hypothetical protein
MKQKHYKLYIKAILYCNFWSYIFFTTQFVIVSLFILKDMLKIVALAENETAV